MLNFSAEEYIKELENSITIKTCKKIPVPQLNHDDNYIFISYSHHDYKKVYKDLAYMYEQGIPFWYDEGIIAGNTWHEVVREKMNDPRCSGVIFYLSESLFLSHSIQMEIRIATGADDDPDTPQVPLKYFCVNLTDMPPSKLLSKTYPDKIFLNANDEMKEKDAWHHTLAKAFRNDVIYLTYEENSHQQILQNQIREFFGILPQKNTYFFGHADFVVGNGIIKFKDESQYTGCFQDNQFNGEGELQFRNNSVYRGSWLKGKRHGEGTHQFSDGAVYQGTWKSDMPNGHGVMTWPDKSEYRGEWKDGKQHNHGIYSIPGGIQYNGQWEYGKRHGQGIMTWPDGTKYEGQWKNGKRHGHGVMTWPDGTKYDGTWQDGKRHGLGIIRSVDGKEAVGMWSNDQSYVQSQITDQDSVTFTDNQENSKNLNYDMHGRNYDDWNNDMYQNYSIRDKEYDSYWNVDTDRVHDIPGFSKCIE